ncbi:MAG: 20S proteasome subunit alpha 4, PSMA7 [Amphiamblys sp. WSBS2006]|nr:MAG: 20S proteasome subunit alpha 4, PSMA7 [Amphiamblys sp. WSBS2006]
MSYDRALTVFSPDGHLFQVDYAIKAVERGSAVVAVTGADFIVVGIEKREANFLQRGESAKKLEKVGGGLWIGFSGLGADARTLIDRARVESQSYRLRYDEGIGIEALARYVAGVQQKYTMKGGVRPFGVGVFVAGFDASGKPRLFFSEPSGVHLEWAANAIGQNSKEIRRLLEKNYVGGLDRHVTVRTTIRCLLEAVQASAGNMEVCVLGKDGMAVVEKTEIERYICEIEASRLEEQREEMDLS